MDLPTEVTITEVGPRDGLQNEAKILAVDDKVRLIDALVATGIRRIEVAAFVRPDAVPQMADAAAVFGAIARRPGVTYIALVPNAKGAERAIAAGADELAFVVSASESHNQANVNRSIMASLEEFTRVVALGRGATVPVTAYISTAFGCPYEGQVPPARVLGVADELLARGATAIALGDTIGIANPRQVADLVSAFRSAFPDAALRLHFHDTRGAALANVLAALLMGVTAFDASIGGLGGCPYAPGASGNVATEDLVAMLDAMGIQTGIALPALIASARLAERLVGRPLPGHVKDATLFQGMAAEGQPIPNPARDARSRARERSE